MKKNMSHFLKSLQTLSKAGQYTTIKNCQWNYQLKKSNFKIHVHKSPSIIQENTVQMLGYVKVWNILLGWSKFSRNTHIHRIWKLTQLICCIFHITFFFIQFWINGYLCSTLVLKIYFLEIRKLQILCYNLFKRSVLLFSIAWKPIIA